MTPDPKLRKLMEKPENQWTDFDKELFETLIKQKYKRFNLMKVWTVKEIKELKDFIQEVFDDKLCVKDPAFCLKGHKTCPKKGDCRGCLIQEFRKKTVKGGRKGGNTKK
jgi:hypothetical protein